MRSRSQAAAQVPPSPPKQTNGGATVVVSPAVVAAQAEQQPRPNLPPQWDPKTGQPAAMEARASMAQPPPGKTAAAAQADASSGFEQIVKSIFNVERIDALYQELRDGLDTGLKPSRADYGTIADALDKAEDKSQKATELLVNAKLALEEFEIDSKTIVASLKQRARASIGTKTTEKEVEETASTMFPDEWRDVRLRSVRMKGAVEAMESLVGRWHERVRDLRAFAQNSRGV